MDDLLALDGGRAATKWRKRRASSKKLLARNKMRRALQDAREYRWEKEERRKERVARIEMEIGQLKAARRKARIRRQKLREQIEKQERQAFLKRRKAEGYRNPKLPFKDLTGRRYGKLKVVRPGGHNPSGSKRWWVKCDCGSPEKEIGGTNLQQGLLKSCGCLKGESFRRYGRKRRMAAANKARREVRGAISRWRKAFCKNRGDARLLAKLKEALEWGERQLAS